MRPRCSDAARDRGDPLIGTAPPARRWLLIEQSAGWGRDALESLAGLPIPDRAELRRGLESVGARLQLVRRPGARPSDHRADGADRRWAVVDTGPPAGQVWGTLAQGWAAVFSALANPVPAGPGEPILLVCTNGRHDVCCAVRGRPVAAALAAEQPDAVWETTHTGGDRFAANMIVLPDGACYGGLDPGVAADVVAAHRRGVPDVAHLRGVTGRSPQDQVALLAVAPELGVFPWDRARLTARPRRAGSEAAAPARAQARRAGGWSREILLDGRLAAVVHGHNEIRRAELLTCAATAPSRAAVPIVDHVEHIDPVGHIDPVDPIGHIDPVVDP
ncbi:MAG: hypothetical protein M9891_18215 [Austwickia sp.]|nr:hypothetical protein [Austwickia sp.]